METVKELFAAQGRCERIKNTPLPRQYAFFTKSFVWIFVLLLPFALIQHLGWTALPIYIVLATIFTITERIGSRTEDPFELKMEDVAIVFHLPKHRNRLTSTIGGGLRSIATGTRRWGIHANRQRNVLG